MGKLVVKPLMSTVEQPSSGHAVLECATVWMEVSIDMLPELSAPIWAVIVSYLLPRVLRMCRDDHET